MSPATFSIYNDVKHLTTIGGPIEEIDQQLRSTVDLYFQTKSKVLALENECAISPLHQSYVNNLRHALDHLMHGLEDKSNNKPTATGHFQEAFTHLSNLGPDAYQYIAGVMLGKLANAIENVGFSGELGNTMSMRSQAIEHYTRGRELRTPEPEQSMEQFERCALMSKEALLQIGKPARKEVARFWIGVVGGGGLIGILVVILKLLDYI